MSVSPQVSSRPGGPQPASRPHEVISSTSRCVIVSSGGEVLATIHAGGTITGDKPAALAAVRASNTPHWRLQTSTIAALHYAIELDLLRAELGR
ncbi:MAG TPA: hypothetical protein VNZ61_08845 [Roseomonas sp.]|nr:hypothetical protein [Roseomonas sp.]